MDNITESKRICDAATPGPWETNGGYIVHRMAEDLHDVLAAVGGDADAAFIVDAREHYPAYVATGKTPEEITAMTAEIRAMKEEIAGLRAELKFTDRQLNKYIKQYTDTLFPGGIYAGEVQDNG